MLNTLNGGWCNLLRVRKSGVLSRHLHPAPVHGFVLKGQWRYLEHDWVATEGSYVFEPPGETHTLVVDEDCDEMITFFNIRSEEHTSELQSLMRISYAVFCLKKKNKI